MRFQFAGNSIGCATCQGSRRAGGESALVGQRKDLRPPKRLKALHPLSFGFCKGRSVIDFVKPHVRQSACLKLDLRDFFTQVTTGRVFGLLRKMGFGREVSHLIALLTTVRTDVKTLSVGHPDPSFDIREPALRKRQLPQGAPTSPAIANLCAFGMDVRLSGLARSVGAHSVSYTHLTLPTKA